MQLLYLVKGTDPKHKFLRFMRQAIICVWQIEPPQESIFFQAFSALIESFWIIEVAPYGLSKTHTNIWNKIPCFRGSSLKYKYNCQILRLKITLAFGRSMHLFFLMSILSKLENKNFLEIFCKSDYLLSPDTHTSVRIRG